MYMILKVYGKSFFRKLAKKFRFRKGYLLYSTIRYPHEWSDYWGEKMDQKETIKTMLDSLPDKIMIKEKKILEKNEEADRLEVEIKSTDSSYVNQIAGELFEGKKRFKNEVERNSELKLRLSRNDMYKSNLKKLSELRKSVKEESIILSYLKRKFRVAESLSRLGEWNSNTKEQIKNSPLLQKVRDKIKELGLEWKKQDVPFAVQELPAETKKISKKY